MHPTKTIRGAKCEKAKLDGVNAIYLPVKDSFGPQGGSALLFRTFGRGARFTDDGYTIAECQIPKDPFIQLVALSFKESCMRTNEKVGDATTATAVIGGYLYNELHGKLSEKHSESMAKQADFVGTTTLKNNILASADKVKKAITASSKKIETLKDLENLAIVSVKDEKLGKIIAKMAWEVGVDGFIDVVEGFKTEIETEEVRGFRFASKVSAKAFITNVARFEMVAEDSKILITNYALDSLADLSVPLKTFNKTMSKVVVVAPSFSDDILVDFTKAWKAGYKIYPVSVPSLRTDQLEDLATYCGAVFFDKAKGKNYRNAVEADLGFVGKIIIKDIEAREDGVITGGGGTFEQETSYTAQEEVTIEKNGKKIKEKRDVLKTRTSTAVADRIQALKDQLKETREDRFKKLLERRIASMNSAGGIIKVGDSTQGSALFRKLKIEDAVYACKAALRSGYVKGGGLCLKEIADKLPENDVLKNALLEPYNLIQAQFPDGCKIADTIIDSAEGIYYAVEHATAVVSNLVTVKSITPEHYDIEPGTGYLAIAGWIREMVISQKIQMGQLKENEAEMYRDSMNGLTDDETVVLDRG